VAFENALYPSVALAIFADAHNQRTTRAIIWSCCWSGNVEGLIVVANCLSWTFMVLGRPQQRNIPSATIGWELPGGNNISSVMVD